MRLLIAGDFCPFDRVREAFENEDFASVLSEVRDITDGADYSIVNFECPISSDEAEPIEKNGPCLCCPSSGVMALRYAGFNCVTLANNHFLDFGDKGVKKTLNILDDNGIDHVGGGMNLSDASQILYKEIAGQCLAIINCCEHEFSIATNNSAGSNPLNPIQQYYAILQARKQADKVIVIVHGGHEHFQFPSLRMVETYRFFISAGADAVVNHHQHCYSGYEVYKGKPIFYGVGNFCFDNPKYRNSNWNEGYLLNITLDKEDSFEIVPYLQCSNQAKVKILNKNVYDNKIEEINRIISEENTLVAENHRFYQSQNRYTNILEPFRNRLYLSCKSHGLLPSFVSKKRKLESLNFIDCESHRDILLWKLKN